MEDRKYIDAHITTWWQLEKVYLNFLKDSMVSFDTLLETNVYTS